MKSKHFTSNAAATELSDQALLGVLGGCDTGTGPAVTNNGAGNLASADSLNRGTNNTDEGRTGNMPPSHTNQTGTNNTCPPAGTSGTRTAPQGGNQGQQITGNRDTNLAGAGDRQHPDSASQHEKAFDKALDEIDHGWQEVTHGWKDLAHAAIDSFPEHGPLGIGIRILDKIVERRHGHH